MDTTTTTKKFIDPTDKVLQLRSRASPRTSTFVAKIFLRKFGEVELHALGEATKSAVRVAENLQRQGLVTITKVSSFTQTLNESRKVKLVVLLTVTPAGKTQINEQIKQ